MSNPNEEMKMTNTPRIRPPRRFTDRALVVADTYREATMLRDHIRRVEPELLLGLNVHVVPRASASSAVQGLRLHRVVIDARCLREVAWEDLNYDLGTLRLSLLLNDNPCADEHLTFVEIR